MLSWGVLQTALELGLIYAMVALALFLSYSMLNVCDLSTDGCYTLGCAVGSIVALSGHPVLAVFAAIFAGVLSGWTTAFLQTKMRVECLLAGIIVNTGLYSINIGIMGKSTLSLNDTTTIFTYAKALLANTIFASCYKLVVIGLFTLLVAGLLLLLLRTRLGLSLRATGDNPDMIRSSSINPSHMVTIGLCISGGITALAGCLIGEYNKTCDINMGTGMVTVALASLMIGETLFGKRSIPFRAVGVIAGACLYRILVGVAMRFHLPASALKLVSAIIVAVAISYPTLIKLVDLEQKKLAAKGKNLYRMLTVAFGCTAMLLAAASAALAELRPLLLLLSTLSMAGLIWSVLRDRKKGGVPVC